MITLKHNDISILLLFSFKAQYQDRLARCLKNNTACIFNLSLLCTLPLCAYFLLLLFLGSPVNTGNIQVSKSRKQLEHEMSGLFAPMLHNKCFSKSSCVCFTSEQRFCLFMMMRPFYNVYGSSICTINNQLIQLRPTSQMPDDTTI